MQISSIFPREARKFDEIITRFTAHHSIPIQTIIKHYESC
jgi:hypothetical protein